MNILRPPAEYVDQILSDMDGHQPRARAAFINALKRGDLRQMPECWIVDVILELNHRKPAPRYRAIGIVFETAMECGAWFTANGFEPTSEGFAKLDDLDGGLIEGGYTLTRSKAYVTIKDRVQL